MSVGAMVFTVVVVALGAWFGLRMRAGANWARITIAVLAALGILGMLVTLLLASAADAPQAGGVLTPILQVITLVLLVGFLVVAFRRPANQYFASTPRAR